MLPITSNWSHKRPKIALVMFMTEIVVKPGDSFEVALKRFNRKVQEAGILSEARRRRHYESPQARRKRKAEAQRRRRRRAR
jgi:small subunit ribosomal protein S21